jgi:hypothetical protein
MNLFMHLAGRHGAPRSLAQPYHASSAYELSSLLLSSPKPPKPASTLPLGRAAPEAIPVPPSTPGSCTSCSLPTALALTAFGASPPSCISKLPDAAFALTLEANPEGPCNPEAVITGFSCPAIPVLPTNCGEVAPPGTPSPYSLCRVARGEITRRASGGDVAVRLLTLEGAGAPIAEASGRRCGAAAALCGDRGSRGVTLRADIAGLRAVAEGSLDFMEARSSSTGAHASARPSSGTASSPKTCSK